jgi:hypothetical protein
MPTLDEFLSTPDPPTLWLCDPYVARDSITFLHGKTSIGKSPLTWELARCISQGIPFLGWHTNVARVLYVEADTPAILVKPRLRLLPKPRGAWWIECIQDWGLDLANPGQRGVVGLRGLYDACKPELVIWNTLRSLTKADLSRGETVQAVYGLLRQCFPGSAHFIVHHNRKESTRPDTVDVPDEDHSGSSGWRDTAQIVLHMRYRHAHLVLEHTKTQGSPKMSPLRLELAEDGTTWLVDPRRQAVRRLWFEALAADPSQSRRKLAERLATDLSVHPATIYRLLGPVA